ncbi:MAG: hypothetical protein RMK19_09305, partial [Bacteroidia bacterium]|nr:hypothetical protein [Bacteroidia bacterium]
LYYPMSLEGIFSALAYCVGKEAALGIFRSNTPISLNADVWSLFYERKAFRRLRVLYPSPVRRMGFNPSLSPYPQKGIHKLISYLAHKLRLPPLLSVPYLEGARAHRKAVAKEHTVCR